MQIERHGIDTMVRWTVKINVVPNVLGAIYHRFDLLELSPNASRYSKVRLFHNSRPSRRITLRSDSGHCSMRTKSTGNGAASSWTRATASK